MDRSHYSLTRLKWQLAGIRAGIAANRLQLVLRAGFRPDQPRIPRGSGAESGEWVRLPGYAKVIQVTRRPTGTTVRIGNLSVPITPAQQMLLAQSHAAMRDALRDVARVDANWKPPAQLYSTVDGLISAYRTIEHAARFRIFELSGMRAGLGPYAAEWLPAPTTRRRLNRQEQQELDRIGRKYGCHWCGSKDPGTSRGSHIGDHQMPWGFGFPTRIYPHCLACSRIQGGIVKQYLYRWRQ